MNVAQRAGSFAQKIDIAAIEAARRG